MFNDKRPSFPSLTATVAPSVLLLTERQSVSGLAFLQAILNHINPAVDAAAKFANILDEMWIYGVLHPDGNTKRLREMFDSVKVKTDTSEDRNGGGQSRMAPSPQNRVRAESAAASSTLRMQQMNMERLCAANLKDHFAHTCSNFRTAGDENVI